MSTISTHYLTALYEKIHKNNLFIEPEHKNLKITEKCSSPLSLEEFISGFDTRVPSIGYRDSGFNIKNFFIEYYNSNEGKERGAILKNLPYYIESHKCNLLNFLSTTHNSKEDFIKALNVMEYKYIGVATNELSMFYDICQQKEFSHEELLSHFHSLFYNKRKGSIKVKNAAMDFIIKKFPKNTNYFLDIYPQLSDKINGISLNVKDFSFIVEKTIICLLDIDRLEKKFCDNYFSSRQITLSIEEISQVMKNKFNIHEMFMSRRKAFEGRYVLEVRLYDSSTLTAEEYLQFIEKYLLHCHNRAKEKRNINTATIWLEKEILTQQLTHDNTTKRVNKL